MDATEVAPDTPPTQGTYVPMPTAQAAPTSGGDTPPSQGTYVPMPTAQAAPTAQPQNSIPPMEGPPDDGTIMGGLRHRMGSTPGQYVRNVGRRALDLETGLGQIPVEAVMNAAKIQRYVEKKAGIGKQPDGSHELDIPIAYMEKMLRDSTPTDPERAGNVQTSKEIGGLLEYTGFFKAVQELGAAKAITQFAPIEKALKNSPVIAKMLIASMEHGVTGGAQSAAHGGSVSDVLKAAATSAIIGSAFEGAEGAGTKMRTAASDRAKEVAPSSMTIEGADYPLLASERKGASRIAKASAKITGQPEILEARQAAVPVSIGNMVNRAIRTSLERSNTARPDIMQPTGDSQIPAATPRETIEAQLRGHQAMMNEDGFSSLDPAEQQQITDRAGQLQQQLSTMPDPAADRAALAKRHAGYQKTINSDSFDRLDPGTQDAIRTKADAIKASLDAMPEPARLSPQQQQLRDYQALADDPSFAKRSPEFQDRITSQINALKSQLDQGNAFQAHDIEAVIQKAGGDVGAAGQALRDEHIPVYKAIDEANKGGFTELEQHGKDLRTAMQNVTNIEDIPKIRAAIKENDAKIDALFEADNPAVPRNIRQQARLGYKDGSALLDLNAILKGHAYNGVTAAEHADPRSILKREFSGGPTLNRKLQNLIEDRPEELTNLLGPQGITNLKQMGTLLSTPSSAYEAQGLLGSIARAFRAQKGRNKSLAGVAAFGPGHVLAASGLHGAAASAEGAQHYVLQRMATDAAFNKQFQYAVNNKVKTSISVPLLTGMLTNWINGKPKPDTTGAKPDATSK